MLPLTVRRMCFFKANVCFRDSIGAVYVHFGSKKCRGRKMSELKFVEIDIAHNLGAFFRKG